MSTEKIIEQYSYDLRLDQVETILREVILIARIEETGYFGEFVRKVGTGWMFSDMNHTTWDLEATLEEARPRNPAAADVTPPHERAQVTVEDWCPACSHPWDYHVADNPKGLPYRCHMSGFSTKDGKPCRCTEVKP